MFLHLTSSKCAAKLWHESNFPIENNFFNFSTFFKFFFSTIFLFFFFCLFITDLQVKSTQRNQQIWSADKLADLFCSLEMTNLGCFVIENICTLSFDWPVFIKTSKWLPNRNTRKYILLIFFSVRCVSLKFGMTLFVN